MTNNGLDTGARGVRDELRKQRVLLGYTGAAAAVCLLMGSLSLIDALYFNGVVLIVIAAIALVMVYVFRLTGNLSLFEFSILLLTGLTIFYLLVTGGRDNAGPLWGYIFPLLSFYILGHRLGVIVVLVYLVVYIGVLYSPGESLLVTTYPEPLKLRIAISLAFTVMLVYLLERSAATAQAERDAAIMALDKASRTDSLTGLINRTGMIEYLEQEVKRFSRTGRVFCIAMCDIDNFKAINDSCGHDCGDYVIKSVAETITSTVRGEDKVARCGGEEYLLLFPDTDLANAQNSVARLKRMITSHSIRYSDRNIDISISFGLAEYESQSSIDDIIRVADRRLYSAKRSGKNAIVANDLSVDE